jgi:hypothetical protein
MRFIQIHGDRFHQKLEHEGYPKTAAHFSASCSGIAIGLDAILAGVAELVDALDLGSSDESCGGSSPSARTILLRAEALRRIKCCVSAKQDALQARHRRAEPVSREGIGSPNTGARQFWPRVEQI